MARAFKLPDLGEGIHEGEVLSVRVKVGQEVKEGDIILEVETDKAAVEIPSPYSGQVLEILVQPGDVVKVGQAMLTFSETGEAAVSLTQTPRTAPKAEKAASVVETAPPAAAGVRQGPVPASPATRRLARELGVDLKQVPATGAAGLVSAEDVRAFASRGKSLATAPPPAAAAGAPLPALTAPLLPEFQKWGPVARVPFRSIRRATARQMMLAWSQIPHVNSQDLVDVTRLEAFRQKHKKEIEARGGKLTLTVFAVKAVATALKAHPQFNASLDLAAGEIVLKNYFHIGVAVNTADGLIVPVVRDVERKNIKELAVELRELIQRTHDRQVALDELQGGCFTITNAGAMGGGFFTPIINYPQVAILGMGQARLQPAVVAGKKGPEIQPRLMMPVVVGIDHRVLDGADAIAFLKTFCETMQDPDEMLLSMI